MGLESASYPNQLVATNPTGSDPKSTADDHIRLLKSVIQTTFPNLTGAMTAAQADLNKVGVTQPQTSNDTSVSSTAFVQTAVAAAITAIGAGASMWVSGTTYALGNVVWSPSNYQTYRRIIAGAGTTDPASDATNWVLVSGNVQTTATQTLTNKTLDAPVITGGASISGNVSVVGTVSATGRYKVTSASDAMVQLTNTTASTGKDWLLNSHSDGKLYFGVNGVANYADLSSTGLAVAGDLSATGTITVGTSDATSVVKSGGANTHLTLAAVGASGAVIFNRQGTTESGRFDASGNLLPGANGTQDFGSTSLRWSQVWCTAGAFNTSDATLKTPIRTMQEAELAAGYQMAQELGTFQWLDSVKEKGDKARRHVGLTVQRAAEIMESHGLKPWSYGFMGYDKWAAVTEIVDATEDDDGAYQEQVTRQKTKKQTNQQNAVEIINGKPTLKVETVETDVPVTEQIQVVDADGKPVLIDVQEVPSALDEEGNVVTPAVPAHQVPMLHAVPVMETVTVWKRVEEVRPAGESYAFRSDQLAFFIAAGVAARGGA